MHISMNGEQRALPGPLSVAELLDELGIDRTRVAVEVNQELVPRLEHVARCLADGDQVEVVTLVGGGSPAQPPADKPLVVGKFRFQSRLFTGTGKFATYDLMRDCML